MQRKLDKTMARPIRETPILWNDDALRFVSEMQRVENLCPEQRENNRAQFQANLQQALDTISIGI